MTDRTDTYCVVGAGSSGLTAVKNLLEHGFRVDCYEREDDVGGNWNFGKPNSRVYESTHMISSKPFTQYPDFPMADEVPDYPHHTHLLDYFRSYMRHFELEPHIRFETGVSTIVPFEDGKAWDVTIRTKDGAEETLRYAGVVIANGHNWYPKVPDYPGDFEGEVMHSADYKRADQLRGKRVLVVGGGNTGCDIAVEAAQNARRAIHSTRRGYWYAPKYSYGKPADQVYDLMLSLRLPIRMIQRLFEATLRSSVGDLTRFGLKEPDHRILETHPIVNSLLPYYLGQGDLVAKPDISRLDGRKVLFADGSVEEVDTIVYATGYLIRFPFIDHSFLNWDGDRPRLYKNVFHPERDNIFVIGLIQPDSGQFTLVHWQAVAVAKFLEALERRPEAAERFRALRRENLMEHLGASVQYKESSRHHVEINHMDYLRGLEKVINILEGAA